jgi:ribosomal-protein-alanine N-acetyltransferase
MLKKFKRFFKNEAKLDLTFSPYVVNLAGQNYQLLQANDDSIPDLLQLERAVYSGRTPWNRFSFKTELRKRHDSLYLVLYHGSELAAFIGTRFNLTEAHITNIAVNPHYQQRGLATYLLQLMMRQARKNEIGKMTLEVRADNFKAQTLYRKLGFNFNFIRKNYYLDTQTDAINMVLWLRPRALKHK